MSFRRYVDATAIAQLLGRMVRTPIQQRILVDDMLNDVQLFLPHFDSNSVQKVVDELQSEEGGELPTDVFGDEIERGSYVRLTTKPIRRKEQQNENQYVIPFDSEQSAVKEPAFENGSAQTPQIPITYPIPPHPQNKHSEGKKEEDSWQKK